MKIVPSSNHAALGPTEGEPAFYHWRWYYSVAGLGLWAVLILAMILPRANRTPAVLLILVPVLLVYFAWWIIQKAHPFDPSEDEVLSMMVLSVAVAAAVLWLLGHLFARRTWLRPLLLALGAAMAVALTGVLSFNPSSSLGALGFLLLLSILVLAMVVMVAGYALAGRTCRRRYGPVRFVFLLAAWTLAVSVVGTLVLTGVSSFALFGLETGIGFLLGYGSLIGALLGACIFLISLPFVLVGLNSPLFRPRLVACLRLQPAPSPVDTVAATPPRSGT